jgi:ferredoxin-type protein NapG
VDPGRRAFFTRGARKAAELAVRQADANVEARAGRWVRPPYALEELPFLLACTRCGDCIEACPHHVVFSLSARLGAQVAGTPAMDLLNKGCHLCEDWPCVRACEPGALSLPQPSADEAQDSPPQPRLAVVAIDTGACLPYLGPECGGCAHSCPVESALLWERERPHIDPDHCTGCALCRAACILTPKAITVRSRFSPRPESPAGT